VTPGYHALHENKAFSDASARGRVRATGDDRARLLHALTTNHIQALQPGQQLYAFFLSAQGRILSDAWIACFEDHLLIDVEPEVRESIYKHIDHYIIADDVTLEDVTDSTFSLLAAGKRIYGDLPNKQNTISNLGLIPASAEDARAFRIEQFHPKFGEDFNSTTLPQETGLTYALHFNKGCYLGQEIVERIRSRGHVNKMLAGLKLSPGITPPAGTKVLFNGEEVGQVTSSSNRAAIAMLRMRAARPGTIVQLDGLSAEVTAVS
jgi:tRNA-modifying protein YgfZ